MKNNKLLNKIIYKVIFTVIILVILLSVGVYASKSQMYKVTITFSDGFETQVLTSKTKIKDILSEESIMIRDDEKVFPPVESNIDESKVITIYKDSEGYEKTENTVTEEPVNVTLEEILASYDTIVEKIITEQVEIPYETITKDVSTSEFEHKDSVIQAGQNGIKEIKYRVKYQNDVEVEKTLISEEVIKEPVNKIIQISNIVVSRSAPEPRSAAPAQSAPTVNLGSESEESARAWIIQKESGGNYSAVNGQYYGAYQMMRSRLNGDYSVANQDAVAQAYVQGRYGSWVAAKQFWLAHGWY